MPEMDGYSLCAAVKSADGMREIPLVLLTERRDPAEILKGLERGADNFIIKPFENFYFLERVRRILDNLDRGGQPGRERKGGAGASRCGINADNQQIVELLLSTLEELVRTRDQLAGAQRIAEAHAKDLEATVQEGTRELRSLFDGVPVGLYRTTPTGRIVDANRALVEMLGYSDRQSLLAANVADLYPDLEERRQWQARMDREAMVCDFEMRLRRQDGTIMCVHDNARAVTDAAGRVVCYDGSLQDITERKQLQEQLRQTEKLATLGELIAGIAHELNNPLAVVVGNAQLLCMAEHDPATAARVERILQAADRTTRVVRNLLTFAHCHQPQKVPVHVNDSVARALELFAYQLRVANIAVETRLAPALPLVAGDPHQLQQVMVNLINNACQAMAAARKGGTLRLATDLSPDARTIAITVADNGPGILPEHLPRIFEPFFTTKPAGVGTGLGLTIANGIVSDHGGTITVESVPGAGATFVVSLPVSAVSAPSPQTGEPKLVPAGLRILVVDDEAAVLEMLADALTAKGNQVETAASGEQALGISARWAADVVVLEARMPGINGPGLWTHVNQTDPALARRIVFCTGDVVGEDLRRFLDSSGCPAVSKPFEWGDFFDAVARAAAR